MASTFIPTSLTGCLLWLDANDTTTINASISPSQNITKTTATNTIWNDKSGNSRNMTQSTTSSAPTYGVMANGMLGLSFKGNKYMTNTTIPFPTSYSVFAVGCGTGTGYGRILNGNTTTNDGNLFMGADTTGSYYASFVGNGGSWNDANANVTNYNCNSLCLMEMTNNNTSNGLIPYFNGIAQTPKNGTTVAFTGLSVGLSYNNGDQYWNGYVCEIIIYNSVLSTSNRQLVEGYLANKWRFNSSLPKTHPYYNYPQITAGITPSSIANCVLWFDANDSSTISMSSSKVSEWRDKSGNNYKVIQPNSGNQPTYTTNLLNGKPGIVLSNTSWLYQLGSNISAFSGSSDTTVFIVARNDSSLPANGWSIVNTMWFTQANGTGTYRYHFSFASSLTPGVTSIQSYYPYTSNQDTTNVVGYGENAIIGFSWSSTSNVIYVNGNTTTFSGQTVLSADNSTTVFNFGDSRQSSYIKDIAIYEFIGFNSKLTTVQQQQIEGYLAFKWGLQSNLPKTHPFYSIPQSAFKFNNINSNSLINVWPGFIYAYTGTTDPIGWVICDGQIRTDNSDGKYNNLAAMGIGTGGSGTSNYRPPDLRNAFLRGDSIGTATSKGTSTPAISASNVNNFQSPVFPNHTHSGNTSTNASIISETTHYHVFYTYNDDFNCTNASNNQHLGAFGSCRDGANVTRDNKSNGYDGGDRVNVNGNSGATHYPIDNKTITSSDAGHNHSITFSSTGDTDTNPYNYSINWILKY
uniref:Phage tail collar domain-containing protein n=1 Tax=viral metagenome TaxID=1070528 RepID=A0A6C0JN90_9ZZZZ